jgi:hypothetical protein
VRELKPYRTLHGMQAAIDNGGRLYHLFSTANDQVVSRGELAKASGVFSAGVEAFLFFEMAQQELSAKDREAIVKRLDFELARGYRRFRPQVLLPSAVEQSGAAGKSVIVSGFPRFVEDRTEIASFVMIPVGDTFTMMPVFDKFDVYEAFDDRKMQKPNSLVATTRGRRLTHDGPIRFGGVLRKLTGKNKTQKLHQLYLETLYYTKL